MCIFRIRFPLEPAPGSPSPALAGIFPDQQGVIFDAGGPSGVRRTSSKTLTLPPAMRSAEDMHIWATTVACRITLDVESCDSIDKVNLETQEDMALHLDEFQRLKFVGEHVADVHELSHKSLRHPAQIHPAAFVAHAHLCADFHGHDDPTQCGLSHVYHAFEEYDPAVRRHSI